MHYTSSQKNALAIGFVQESYLREQILDPVSGKFINKAPRRKQRGINYALQSAGFQPAFASRDGELDPGEIKS